MTRDNMFTYLRELSSELDYDMLLRQRFGVPIAGLRHNPQIGCRGVQVSTAGLGARVEWAGYIPQNEPRLLHVVLREIDYGYKISRLLLLYMYESK